MMPAVILDDEKMDMNIYNFSDLDVISQEWSAVVMDGSSLMPEGIYLLATAPERSTHGRHGESRISPKSWDGLGIPGSWLGDGTMAWVLP
jgi:hypothetical protein